jgi:hypothetical protein
MRRRRRVKRGGSIFGWLKKANTFLRKHKVLSTAGNLIGKTGLPYASQIGKAGKYAGMAGYGHHRGRGTTPTGGALRLAGMGRRRRRRCR